MKDVLRLGHQHAADLVLVNGHRQNVFRRENGLVTGLGELDSAGLATVSNLHLRLNHFGISNLVGRFGDFMGVLGEYCLRSRDTLFFEQFPGLILIEIHGSFPLVVCSEWLTKTELSGRHAHQRACRIIA